MLEHRRAGNRASLAPAHPVRSWSCPVGETSATRARYQADTAGRKRATACGHKTEYEPLVLVQFPPLPHTVTGI